MNEALTETTSTETDASPAPDQRPRRVVSRRWSMASLAMVVVVGALVVPAPPAMAHGSEKPPPTNYRNTVESVEPAPTGVRVAVIEAGNRLELTNRGPDDIVVIGYEGEPMLRVGPAGAFENRRSPSLYRSAVPPRNVPPDAGPASEPQWRRLSRSVVVRWHDLRADPGQAKEAVWTVPLRHQDQPVAVTGSLTNVPGPRPVPWLAASALLLAATAAAAVLRPRRWRMLVAAVLAVTVVLDVVHNLGQFAASYATLSNRLFDLFFPLLAWVGAGVALRRLARRPTALPLLAGYAGIGLFFMGGMGGFAALSHSQLPFAYPDLLARLAVTSALGVGGGLAVALVWYATVGPVSVPGVPADPAVSSTEAPPDGAVAGARTSVPPRPHP